MVKKCFKFGASWCAPCKILSPVFEKVSKMDDFKNIEFKDFDIEEDDAVELVEKFAIRNVPTIVLLDENDEVLKKSIGSVPEDTLIEIIKSEMV